MNGNISVLTVAGGTNAAMSGFIVMTVTSIGLLCLLPVVGRRHVSKFGIYAHEMGHGVVSVLTGGEFHRFHVGSGGGLCVTAGGNRKAVTAAGYIGTVVLGAIFLARSAQSETVVIALQVMAILLALSTLKAGDLHTAGVGMVVAAILGLCSTLLPGALATRFLLNLMGVILVWEGSKAVTTLLTISARMNNTGSDAEVMAGLTGRSPLQWAVVFGGIALVALLVIVGLGVRAGSGSL